MLKVDSYIGATYQTICSSVDVSIECNARVPTLDVTRRDIWLNKPRCVAHRRYFHSAHKVHTRCIQKRLIANLIYSGQSKRADRIFLPRSGVRSLSLYFHCFARGARTVLHIRCTFLAFGCSTMQSVETDTIQTIYLPSIVTQASLSLAHVAFRAYKRSPIGEKEREWKLYTGCTLTTRGICYVSCGKSAIFPVYFQF